MDQEKKAKFMRIYSNLPINLRSEIISVINGEPITWNVAYLEINKETELGGKILKNLSLLGLL